MQLALQLTGEPALSFGAISKVAHVLEVKQFVN